MTKKILLACTCSSLCTGIIASILWLAISGVNWLGFFAIDAVFLINGLLSGAIASFIQGQFKHFPIMLSLYLGNTIPLGVLLLVLFLKAEPSMEAWFLMFLIGWLIVSIIPTAIALVLHSVRNNRNITNTQKNDEGNHFEWKSQGRR